MVCNNTPRSAAIERAQTLNTARNGEAAIAPPSTPPLTRDICELVHSTRKSILTLDMDNTERGRGINSDVDE